MDIPVISTSITVVYGKPISVVFATSDHAQAHQVDTSRVNLFYKLFYFKRSSEVTAICASFDSNKCPRSHIMLA